MKVEDALKRMAGLPAARPLETLEPSDPVPVEGPPLSEGSAPEGESEARRQQMYFVYSAVADAMPTEGRDFRVEVSFDGPDPSSPGTVRLRPITEIGRHFCTHLAKVLRSRISSASAGGSTIQPQGDIDGTGK